MAPLRIAHLADTHIGMENYGRINPETGLNQRLHDFLASLDYFFDRMRNAVGSQEREWGLPIVEKMALQPSEYFARQCHIGASFIRPGTWCFTRSWCKGRSSPFLFFSMS